MLISMTGYGFAKKALSAGTLSVEIKSVNHRYLDMTCQWPFTLPGAEEEIKRLIKTKVNRGKVYIQAVYEEDGGRAPVIRVNQPLFDAYMRLQDKVKEDYPEQGPMPLADLLQIDGMILQETEGAEELGTALLETASHALENFQKMRQADGVAAESDLLTHIKSIGKVIDEVSIASSDAQKQYRGKLAGRMREILEDQFEIDEARLLNEAAIYADKTNIDEEISRLKSHISQFLVIMNKPDVKGRKLDFLIQEMNREANTIGSKAQHAGISQAVVNIKSELEKIREQVQNIE